jgi:nuclear pore complex protein Nup155
VLDINTLYNNYADNAGYYDLCLMIYQVADHRDPAQIRQTWLQLFQSVHDKTEKDQSCQPFEAITNEVRSLGSKLRVSETTFPIPVLLPTLEKYSFDHQRNIAPAHWVVDVFLSLDVPYEKLFDILENMFFAGEAPFVGSNRRVIASDLLYVVGKWFHESTRAGTVVFGSEAAARRIVESLQTMLSQTTVGAHRGAADEETLAIAREVVSRVAGMIG